MTTRLMCPDCGGVLGNTAPGEAPCTCLSGPPDENPTNSDTATIEAPIRPEKLCVVCGKDTTGHRRLKDSRGYICYKCAVAERDAERAGKARCEMCRKLVKRGGLVPLNKKMVCRSCHADFEESAKFTRKISMKEYDVHEKRNLIILAILFVILAAIVIYSLYFKHR